MSALILGVGVYWGAFAVQRMRLEVPRSAETHGDQSPIIQGDNNTVFDGPPPKELLERLAETQRSEWEREFPLGYSVAIAGGVNRPFVNSAQSEIRFDWNHFELLHVTDLGVTFNSPLIDTRRVKGTTLRNITIGPLKIGAESLRMSIGNVILTHRIVLVDGKYIGILIGAAPETTP